MGQIGIVTDRWYVEVENRTAIRNGWQREPGKWVFEAAVVKAREIAINGMVWTRLVKA